MNILKIVSLSFVLLVGALFAAPVSAQLTANYTFDESGFFSSIPAARLAAEAALADINDALNQNLSAIEGSDQTIVSSFQSATVTLNILANITNPSSVSGASVGVPVENDESVVQIYLGARPQSFENGVSVLGVGGTAAYGFGSIANFSSRSDLGVAAENAGNEASDIFTRGEGPLVSKFDSAFIITDPSGDETQYPYTISFGLSHGSVSFDNDTNDNNVDDLVEGVDPGDFFHFDHTTPPAPGKIDFYSVALHESLHAIGLGGSASWTTMISGQNWVGDEVCEYLGSGTGVIDADGGHLKPGILTPRVSDGVLQESALIPSIPAGTRIGLTELDFAILRDLGFTGAIVPGGLAGDFDRDGDVDLADLDRYNGVLGSEATCSLGPLDLDQNGTVDENDFETHYSTLVQTSNGTAGTAVGDINLDGSVDVLRDAFILVANLGNSAASWSQGDLNADGTVDVLGDAFSLVANLGADNG